MAKLTPANNLSVGSVSGNLSWYKKKTRLYFKENEPLVYKAQPLRGCVVKGDDLIAYAANAAHVPETTIRMAKDALFQAINYFCTQGRLVQVPQLGGFKIQVNSKSVKTSWELDEVGTGTIQHKRLRWFPKESIARLGRLSNVCVMENKELSKLALAAPDPAHSPKYSGE